MKNKKVKQNELQEPRKTALHYMKTLVEVARESFLILDADLRVISANPIFYQAFQVSLKETEGLFLYELGDGQWDIPQLKKLLENILPDEKVVKNFEVTHDFEAIGRKTMLLNARQIDQVQLIILAIEDITDRKKLEEELAEYTKDLEGKVAKRTSELASRVKELETLTKSMEGRELKMVELKKEIEKLKKPVKNSNSKNGKGKNNNGNHKRGSKK